MAKILLVDDDKQLCEQVSKWLVHDRHIVETVHDQEQALEFLRITQFDLMVLDWQLGCGGSGMTVLKTHRQEGGRIPVIVLTGRHTIEDKEEGLNSGADDYLTKPFEMKELSARIRALLRRPPLTVGNILTISGVSIDTVTKTATTNGITIQLLPKEFALLELFMRNPNRVFSPEALLNHGWKADTESSVDTVRTYIKTLRKKIVENGGPSIIKTVHGMGYKIES